MSLRPGLTPTLFCLAALLLSPAAFGQTPLLGFSPAHSAQERALEARFDATLNKENLRNWMQRLSAHPHHVGSPYDKSNADFIAAQFRAWGYDTQIEQFDVLFPTPKVRLLEMTDPKRFRARLDEPTLKEDSTSGDRRNQLPPYNAYSVDGDVTGELVYVNYGIPKDYEALEARGISVKGKIVLARYGGSWRGIKPKVAAEHGAIGCLIYSDPRDDGYFQGDVYPRGSYRNEFGAQRGSVADMPLHPGDPLTPGIGATKDAPRLALKDAKTLTKIPTLPISYADALPLLRELKGPVAPEAWRGALSVTYHLGPGPAVAHLKLQFDWKQTAVYDVIARLPGSERPDEWILRGNHHDAWVFGAEDPLSGTVALMEEARAVGELAKSGARPKRTIVYTVWDGEEPGLLGSTEWVETHAAELAGKAALYVNSDSNGRGFLSAGGSHTLEKFLHQVALDVIDPEKGISVAERARANRLLNGTPEVKKETKASGETHLTALGSGSDYTPFLQHLGIASLNLGYGGENGGGSYHSIYDSFDWYARFGDPDFRYGIALAQTAGRIVLRAANADVLPWQFTALADTVEKYGKEIVKLADDMREETQEKNRAIEERLYDLTFDPTETHIAPKLDTPVPMLDFKPLNTALAHLKAGAQKADAALTTLAAGGYELPLEQQKSLDALLIQTERVMLRYDGLPRRSWYRHQIYAPGFYTGYGVKTLPGIREAIEQREWSEAAAQIPLVAGTLENVAVQIDKITELLASSQQADSSSSRSNSSVQRRLIMKSEFLYETAPFPSCHASTIVESKGSLVAAWFGGTDEKEPDVGIWLSRHEGGQWTAPKEVADGVQSPALRYPCWNPVLFQPRQGPLLLFYKVGPSPSTWWGMLIRSEDGGKTWSRPERLPEGILGPIKNKPVQLENGDILCPTSCEDKGWQVHFERTGDMGKTWQSTGPVNDGKEIAAIQPSVLLHAGAHLQAIGRTRQGRLFTIESQDAGKTWGAMTLTDLPNPNSGTDAVTLRDSRFLLVYNHTPRGRSPLNVALSKDGKSWTPVATLEDSEGEYSYPAVIQSSDGLIHITYTWKRQRIRHVVLNPAQLK